MFRYACNWQVQKLYLIYIKYFLHLPCKKRISVDHICSCLRWKFSAMPVFKLTCKIRINQASHRGALRVFPQFLSYTNVVAFWVSGLWDIGRPFVPVECTHWKYHHDSESEWGFLAAPKLLSSSSSRSSLYYVWSFVETRTKVGISQIALHLWTVPQSEVSFIAGGDQEQFCVSFKKRGAKTKGTFWNILK